MKKGKKFSSSVANLMPMITYILKRLLYMIPIMLVISLLLFILLEMVPGDPVFSFISPEEQMSMTAVELQAYVNVLRERLGLIGPFHIRYIKWLLRLLTGDLGYSSTFKTEIVTILPMYLKNTFYLNIIAYVISFVISIFIGIKSAVKRNKFFDKFFTVFSLVGISLPSFFIALILLFVFAVNLGWLPFGGMTDPSLQLVPGTWAYTKDVLYHMILPVTVITLGSMATIIRYVKNSMLEVLKQDYIKTARAKGLKSKVVIYRHAFRNTLVPLVTLIGNTIPGLFAGAIVMEKIFTWPGMGLLMNKAYSQRDRALILAVTLLFAVMTLISNLLVDVSYAFVDPRIKVGGDKNE